MGFKTGLPLTEKEISRSKPTLEGAFRRFENAIAKKRRRKGFHQSYLTRATPNTKKIGVRIVGSE